MKRQSSYGDANTMNSYPPSPNQMQHVSLHRMQENSGLSNYSARMGSFMHEDDRSYASSANVNARWQWERDTQQMSPHLHREAQDQQNDANLSFYQNRMSHLNLALNKEPGVHLQEEDMDLGRRDDPSLQTFEGFEKKLSDDIMKLTKKHMDSEDTENERHREKILEINNQYQEKLVALRARYAARREGLLQKESHARLQQYQLTTMSRYQNDVPGPADMSHRGGGSFPGEAQRPFAVREQFSSHKQRGPSSESYGRGRMQGTGSRTPPSSGRGYNTGPRYY